MFEQQTVLRRIEQLVDKLPYLTVEIRIELPGQLLVLSKEKQRKIGFDTNPSK